MTGHHSKKGRFTGDSYNPTYLNDHKRYHELLKKEEKKPKYDELDGFIKIETNRTMIELFKKYSCLLDEIRHGDINKNRIESALTRGDFIKVLDEISEVTTKSVFGWVPKEGFFKEYPEWIEEILISSLKQSGVEIAEEKNDKEAMYTCLFISQYVLDETSLIDLVNKDHLLEQAISLYYKYSNSQSINISSKAYDMLNIFIDCCIGNKEFHLFEGGFKIMETIDGKYFPNRQIKIRFNPSHYVF